MKKWPNFDLILTDEVANGQIRVIPEHVQDYLEKVGWPTSQFQTVQKVNECKDRRLILTDEI